jgi:hypothetical protein
MEKLTLETAKKNVFYYSYDKQQYPFHDIIQKKIFNINVPLEKLSTAYPDYQNTQVTFETDTSTFFHNKYYKSENYSEVISLYMKFLKECIMPLFNEDILVVQKEPSFRVCLPNNTALGKRSDQSDTEIIGIHCDSDYGHPPEEINFILSITGQEESNSCYIESSPNMGDFFPVKIQNGEFISFYGNRCRHYNKKNITGKTRVSFDFRVIPFSKYKESDATAIHSKRAFKIGDYYTIIQK